MTARVMKMYSAKTPMLIKTYVSLILRQINVAKLINITETMGVRNFIFIKANIEGM
jgi:hypothetical protein